MEEKWIELKDRKHNCKFGGKKCNGFAQMKNEYNVAMCWNCHHQWLNRDNMLFLPKLPNHIRFERG